MKMFLISDNVDTLTGMRLAGVEGCIVHERAELRKALEDAIANKENGIILLTCLLYTSPSPRDCS